MSSSHAPSPAEKSTSGVQSTMATATSLPLPPPTVSCMCASQQQDFSRVPDGRPDYLLPLTESTLTMSYTSWKTGALREWPCVVWVCFSCVHAWACSCVCVHNLWLCLLQNQAVRSLCTCYWMKKQTHDAD